MYTFHSNTEACTAEFAADMALVLRQGDLVLLNGELGTGKTALSRGIIRAILDDDALEVASPTFSIVQEYAGPFPVYHLDLYRLSGPDDLDEIGLEEMLECGLVVVEWPERCLESRPNQSITIRISADAETRRRFEISGSKSMIDKIVRSLEVRKFLDENGWKDACRTDLMGDASSRAYESINNGDALLMNAPALPDGPPVRNGKPYSQIAHLAEDISAFVAIDQLLLDKGFRAPKLFATDLQNGMLLSENLGCKGIIDAAGNPIPERYLAAAEMLACLHCCDFENAVTFGDRIKYTVPSYDFDAMMIEVELLKDWYIPDAGTGEPDLSEFLQIWTALINEVQNHPKSLVLRDFHSPNLLWQDDAEGTDRIGIIDFQDAVIGPQAYDVASLAQDARVDIPETLEMQLLDHYVNHRKRQGQVFEEAQFRASYAIMAAQRATKILGIFVRLDVRDGKPDYRVHIPRLIDYLRRSTTHPVLENYRIWLKSVIEL